MNREALEHLLRAAAALTGESTFYVVGAAAILPSLAADADPDVVRRSREADLIPESGSTRSIDLIDGALGLDSTFDGTFGYYADGVDLSTVRYAPAGWRDRTIRFESRATGGAVGLCMEAHDLVIAELCAGREKDLDFVQAPATVCARTLVSDPPSEHRDRGGVYDFTAPSGRLAACPQATPSR